MKINELDVVVVTNSELGWDCVVDVYSSWEAAAQEHDVEDDYINFDMHTLKLPKNMIITVDETVDETADETVDETVDETADEIEDAFKYYDETKHSLLLDGYDQSAPKEISIDTPKSTCTNIEPKIFEKYRKTLKSISNNYTYDMVYSKEYQYWFIAITNLPEDTLSADELYEISKSVERLLAMEKLYFY